MRDTLKFKDEEYFNAYIEEQKYYILDFQKALKKGKVVERQINSVKGQIVYDKTELIIGKYSRGDDLAPMKDEYTEVFKEWLPLFSTESYNVLLRMISLGILFGIDDELLDKVSELTAQAGFKDWSFPFCCKEEKTARKSARINSCSKKSTFHR